MRRQRNLLGPQGMGGMVSLWGASSLIKNVQHGSTNIGTAASGTTTITAVNLDNSFILFQGGYNNNTGSMTSYINQTYCRLSDSTTVTAGRYTSSGVSNVIGWMVVEFVPGVIKSCQRLTIVVNNGSQTTNTTITGVNRGKTFLSFGNTYAEQTVADTNNYGLQLFSNDTTVTVTRSGSATGLAMYLEVVEFY